MIDPTFLVFWPYGLMTRISPCVTDMKMKKQSEQLFVSFSQNVYVNEV